jgi:GDP-4-dehydro-6-deoxy-D-mannose reductase
MRILVTGAGGFVGRWMVKDLSAAGHDVTAAPPRTELDIGDAAGVRALLDRARPEAVIHLAGLAYGPDATRDPAEAERVNASGTALLMEGLAASCPGAHVLVAGSSEVYGVPDPAELPLTESSPVGPVSAYGRSKLAQEEAALSAGPRTGLSVAVTRSFNHTGPGQRPEFVAPALARRILTAGAEGRREISVGNVDVRRDIGDVRDVVRAYRLIVEGLRSGAVPPGSVLNVATGRSVAIREMIDLLSDIAGVPIAPRVDPDLVRANDAPEIVGDASRLRALAGWEPRIPLRQTLTDLVESLR